MPQALATWTAVKGYLLLRRSRLSQLSQLSLWCPRICFCPWISNHLSPQDVWDVVFRGWNRDPSNFGQVHLFWLFMRLHEVNILSPGCRHLQLQGTGVLAILSTQNHPVWTAFPDCSISSNHSPQKKGSKSSTLPKRAWHFYTQNSYFSVAPIGTHWLKPATLGSPTSVHQGLPAIPPACRGIRSIRSDQSKQLCRSCCRIRSSCHVMNQSVTAGYIWLYDIATLGLQLWVNEKHLLMNLYFINWFNLISLVRLIN